MSSLDIDIDIDTNIIDQEFFKIIKFKRATLSDRLPFYPGLLEFT